MILTARKMSVLSDMAKNLRVKTVVFEIDVVINDDRKKLRSPNASSTTHTNHVPTKTDTSVHKEEVKKTDFPVDPKLRYADKIKMKLAKHNMDTARGSSAGAASLLGSDSRWLLAEGMGELLDYLHNRSIRLAIVGSSHLTQSTTDQLAQQLSATKLSFVRPDFDAEEKTPATLAAWTERSLLDMEQSLHVRKSEVLLVSGQEDTLVAGKHQGYFTCRYRPPGGLYGQVSTDFIAQDHLEIRDAINELTGIALRSSVNFNFNDVKHR